jgi:hypothetical protein
MPAPITAIFKEYLSFQRMMIGVESIHLYKGSQPGWAVFACSA